ncbi:MAG: tRNA (N(6)-L-threonylcarbamoyladenosine(37)-C(2))-methylthiotransferase MtaB [Clostridiales bacterium]|nr:tRNA (N(6)-L-threonylcarbamoyladenosine(37)-C(2))-methylthiotransferase MtaB [Clostridiales bacterium]
MTALFYTLGCKVNQYETQAMRALMEAAGFETGAYEPGVIGCEGVIVINSCTVTGESDRKLRQLLRRCRRDNPGAVLVLTGCMPQAFPEQAARLSDADVVLGNASRRSLPEKTAEFLSHHRRIVEISSHQERFEALEIEEFQGRTRAFVKIEDGCNRFCSYCIIPYARGRVRSRPLEDLRRELESLAAGGYREVVLTGINLTAYGQDLAVSDRPLSLCDAVETACAVGGLQRVRLGSLEPDMLSESAVGRLAAQDRLCPQFHLSLQSGCDETLRRMNRRYTTEEYRQVCQMLRRAFPDCALTTDVMVGFPGESEEDFRRSLAFVEEIGFSKVHVFAYSRRPGTRADRFPDQVERTEKARRSRLLTQVCEASRRRWMEQAVERAAASEEGVEILLETRRADGCLEGYTRDYLPVKVAGGGVPGELIPVRLTALGEEAVWAVPLLDRD